MVSETLREVAFENGDFSAEEACITGVWRKHVVEVAFVVQVGQLVVVFEVHHVGQVVHLRETETKVHQKRVKLRKPKPRSLNRAYYMQVASKCTEAESVNSHSSELTALIVRPASNQAVFRSSNSKNACATSVQRAFCSFVVCH